MWVIIIGLLKKLGGVLKTPQGIIGAFVVVLIIALAAALARVDHWKAEAKEWQAHSVNLELKLAFEKSRQDTIRVPGEYHVDTLWRERVRIDTIGGKVCTTSVPCPELSGTIAIDTSRQYGSADNPFTIRVAGKYYWPPEYAHKNWTVIDVQGWREWPNPIPAARAHSFGLGLAAFTGRRAGQSAAIYARYKRLSFFAGQNLSNPEWQFGLSCELLSFGK